MKCKNCGGEVNTETMVCEYCDCKFEKESKSAKSRVFRWLAVIIIAVIAMFIIAAVVEVAIIGNTIGNVFQTYSSKAEEQQMQTQEKQEELLTNRLPKSATDLEGQIGTCTTDGVVTIYYDNKFYSNVQILDSELISLMAEDGFSPNGTDIMFSTDENRDITEVYIKEPYFFVMHQTDGTYVAIGDDERIITVDTDSRLEADGRYTGYYDYITKRFHSVTATDNYESFSKLKRMCKEKVAEAVVSANTDKEVTVYKLLIGSSWYYCSEDTYNKVNIDDKLSDYTFVSSRDYVYE